LSGPRRSRSSTATTLETRFPHRTHLSDTLSTAERGDAWFLITANPRFAESFRDTLNIRMRPISVRRFASRQDRDAHLPREHRPVAPPEPAPPTAGAAPVDGPDIDELIEALSPAKVRVLAPDGHHIATLAEWLDHAPPKSREAQWRDGRSAKELARAWSGGPVPDDLARFLKRHPATAGFEAEVAFAEHCTALDAFGEPRNHDLVLVGTSGGARVVVGVEAKADEGFGTLTVGAYRERERAKNETRAEAGKRISRVPERIDHLCRALFGETLDDAGPRRDDIAGLRYQLLTALAGTAIEARDRDADRGVLLVHEFVHPEHTKQARLDANRRHLRRFLAALPGVHDSVMPPPDAGEWLLGPIKLPGGGRVPGDVPMYVGKLRTEL
jgi:hypothetical protein